MGPDEVEKAFRQAIITIFKHTDAESIAIHSGDREPGDAITRKLARHWEKQMNMETSIHDGYKNIPDNFGEEDR